MPICMQLLLATVLCLAPGNSGVRTTPEAVELSLVEVSGGGEVTREQKDEDGPLHEQEKHDLMEDVTDQEVVNKLGSPSVTTGPVGLIFDWDVTLFPSFESPLSDSSSRMPGGGGMESAPMGMYGAWSNEKGFGLTLLPTWENGLIPKKLQKDVISEGMTRMDFFSEVSKKFDGLLDSIATAGAQAIVVTQAPHKWVADSCDFLQKFAAKQDATWQHAWCQCFEYIKIEAPDEYYIQGFDKDSYDPYAGLAAADASSSAACRMKVKVLSVHQFGASIEILMAKPRVLEKPAYKGALFAGVAKELELSKVFIIGDSETDEIVAGKRLGRRLGRRVTTLWTKGKLSVPTKFPQQLQYMKDFLQVMTAPVPSGMPAPAQGNFVWPLGLIFDWDLTLFPSFSKETTSGTPLPFPAGVISYKKLEYGHKFERAFSEAWAEGTIPEAQQLEVVSDGMTRMDFFTKVAASFDSLLAHIARTDTQAMIVSEEGERWVKNSCFWLQNFANKQAIAWQHEWCKCFKYVRSAEKTRQAEREKGGGFPTCPMAVLVMSVPDALWDPYGRKTASPPRKFAHSGRGWQHEQEQHEQEAPDENENTYKQVLFAELAKELEIEKGSVAVIGDSATDEIYAGKQLGFTTFLLKAEENAPGKFPEQLTAIDSFLERFITSTPALSHRAYVWPQ